MSNALTTVKSTYIELDDAGQRLPSGRVEISASISTGQIKLRAYDRRQETIVRVSISDLLEAIQRVQELQQERKDRAHGNV